LDFDLYSSLIHSLRLMRFLFVRPEICRRLPSRSTSRWTRLALAIHFPLPGVFGTFTR